MKSHTKTPPAQPRPRTPGLTRQMVWEHALRLFRDVLPARPLREREWRLAEEDLTHKLERDGF
jgi:hypothetical protein